jgi:hypothetical protein
MKIFVIYERPKDYPDQFVVRGWTVDFNGDGQARADAAALFAPDLVAARKLIPRGFYNMGRQPEDDPVIAEVWF